MADWPEVTTTGKLPRSDGQYGADLMLEWQQTSEKRTRHGVRQRLWWSEKFGGRWVND